MTNIRAVFMFAKNIRENIDVLQCCELKSSMNQD